MLSRKEFVDFIAENYNITKKKADEIVEIFTNAFKQVTINDGGVSLTGFIKSELVNRPEREALNPKTGEKIRVPAKTTVKVSACPKFKKMEG